MTRNDVLIIGAGPSGLFAAAELARHGVEARLIEREVRPHRQARATAIQPGTLEILDSVGLLPPFLDAAEHVRCSRLYGPDMAVLGATSHDGIDCRHKFQCSLPQYETQRILEAHLASLGGLNPEAAICMATGNTARVYKLPVGIIEPGREADLCVVDAPVGSVGKTALEALRAGDLFGISMVLIDGQIKIGRSRNTPPAARAAEVVKGHGPAGGGH